MKIDRNNYEQYFLDHAEGNLSPEMEKELADFLVSNPDLKCQLEEFEISPIPIEVIGNDNLKSRLRKSIRPTAHIGEKNIDDWMIGSIEGMLDAEAQRELAEFIRMNPAYNYDLEKYRSTKFPVDLSIRFANKEGLKKKVVAFPKRTLYWLLPAAAAVILIFIGIRLLREPEVVPTGTPSQIAGTPSLPIETPSLPHGTPSRHEGTPSLPIETPSIPIETPSLPPGTPSRHEGTPALGTPARLASFRLTSVEPEIIAPTSEITKSETDFYTMQSYDVLPFIFPEEKEKSLIAKVFSNMVNRTRDEIKQQTNLDELDKTDFSLWNLAKAGVNGFNSISDRDLELYVHRDAEGNVKSYALIEDDRLLMGKTLDKN